MLLLENDYDITLSPKELREVTINGLKTIGTEKKAKNSNENGSGIVYEDLIASLVILGKDLLASEKLVKMNDVEDGTPLFIIHDIFGK